MKTFSSLLTLSLATSTLALAGTEPYFNPLTQSAAVASPNHVNELNSPWQLPAGISYRNLTNMAKIEADIDQSVIRVPGAGTSASKWDMVAFDPTGKYIFIPHETPFGAGVTRYNIEEDHAEILFSGDRAGSATENGTWANDYGAFDPATFTPYGTVLLGEEWSGEGRVIEIINPYAPVNEIIVKEKHSFANLSHEGIRFGKRHSNTVYFVDENNSGSIYKFVANDKYFNSGQTFVLSVDDFNGDATQYYNASVNVTTSRTGDAQWIALTDKTGKPLTKQNPFENAAISRAGRIAADELGATPFGRPEDIEVGRLANGKEVLYFTATSEKTVYSVEMRSKTKAIVREYVSETNTPKNLGFSPTTGVINSPDNLAQDIFGNIYIIEDAPNSNNVGGDIWFARDTNNDGVAESADHFMSLQVHGSEATGMIFNPVKPTEFVVSIQHPSSINKINNPNGSGDALWAFDISNVIPPNCRNDQRYNKFSYANGRRYITTCSSTSDFNYVRKLKKNTKKVYDDDDDD